MMTLNEWVIVFAKAAAAEIGWDATSEEEKEKERQLEEERKQAEQELELAELTKMKQELWI